MYYRHAGRPTPTTLFVLFALTMLIPSIPLALADADKPAAADSDLEKLQGEWHMQSGTTDGMAIPADMLPHMKRICKGDELTVTNGDMLIMKAKIALDSSKTPSTIDYDITDGPNKGKKQLGIYELDGDTFRSAFAAPGQPRPENFDAKPGDKRTVTTWKRADKKE